MCGNSSKGKKILIQDTFFKDVYKRQGFNIAMNTLNGCRIGIAAQALGIAEGAMDEVVTYTKGRVQFGKPIAKFQNTQFEMCIRDRPLTDLAC